MSLLGGLLFTGVMCKSLNGLLVPVDAPGEVEQEVGEITSGMIRSLLCPSLSIRRASLS